MGQDKALLSLGGRSVIERVIECVCVDETARRRLEQDAAEGRHPATNRTYEMYRAVKARFEPILEPKLIVDTDGSLAECVRQAMRYLGEGK